jgi:hypothetical protein
VGRSGSARIFVRHLDSVCARGRRVVYLTQQSRVYRFSSEPYFCGETAKNRGEEVDEVVIGVWAIFAHWLYALRCGFLDDVGNWRGAFILVIASGAKQSQWAEYEQYEQYLY